MVPARRLCLAVCLCASGVLLAQVDNPGARDGQAALVREALARLRSDDLPTVAWGAASAAKHKLEPCLGELRARLTALVKETHVERHLAAGAILDALIQIDAVVPAVELEPLLEWRDALVPVLVLLARRPDDNRKLLGQLFRADDARSLVWVACGNLLATVKDPEFTVDLLRAPVHLKVSVGDGEVVGSSVRGSPFMTWMHPAPPAGYPPTMFYRLGSGARKIADGPLPVRVSRTSNRTDCRSEPAKGYRSLRRTWLLQVLGAHSPDALLDHEQWVEIRWSGRDAYLAGMQERRAEIERDYRELVAACVKAKVVTAAAVEGLAPVIEVQVDDRRGDRSVPVPEVAAKK